MSSYCFISAQFETVLNVLYFIFITVFWRNEEYALQKDHTYTNMFAITGMYILQKRCLTPNADNNV